MDPFDLCIACSAVLASERFGVFRRSACAISLRPERVFTRVGKDGPHSDLYNPAVVQRYLLYFPFLFLEKSLYHGTYNGLLVSVLAGPSAVTSPYTSKERFVHARPLSHLRYAARCAHRDCAVFMGHDLEVHRIYMTLKRIAVHPTITATTTVTVVSAPARTGHGS